MRTLEKFLNSVLENPLLKSSQILYDFLTMGNEEEFNVKKNFYNKKKPPQSLREIKTLKGTINIEYTLEKEIYFSNIKDNANLNESLLKKLSMSYKSLIEELATVRDRMLEVSDIWNQLYKTAEKYYDSQSVSEGYQLMSKITNDWSQTQNKQINLIAVNVREFFKFMKNNFRSVKDLCYKVDTHKSSFYKYNDRLRNKKEELFKRQDISKWELNPDEKINKLTLFQDKQLAFSKMLPRETKHCIEEKKIYGFYINSIIEEFERLRELNGKNYRLALAKYSLKHTNIVAELNAKLADLVGYLGDGSLQYSKLRKIEPQDPKSNLEKKENN